MSTKKHFAKKFKRGTIKLECIVKPLVKIDKLLLKRDKNVKSIKSNMRSTTLLAKSNMRKTTLLAKSNMRLSILNDMGVIIPDPNTMKSNATASSSSPCLSSTEATIPKNRSEEHNV